MAQPPKPTTASLELNTRVLGRGGRLALALGLGLMLCVAAASVWQARANGDALDTARAMRQQRTDTANLLRATQEAETAQRGYLLTLDRAYLAPFDMAVRAMPPLLARVTADDRDVPQAAALRTAVTAKFAELGQTVRLTQEGDVNGAMTVVRTNAGNRDMEAIRTLIAGIEAAQDRLLGVQVSQLTQGNRLLVVFDVASLVMVLGLAGLVGLGVRESLAVLRDAQATTDRANTALQRNNERLDEMVQQRTAELTASNEELQRFAYIVSHDLRSPLVNIMGFTSELEQAANAIAKHVAGQALPPAVQDAVTEDVPEALRFIRTSTSKMDRLINAILRLSREGRRVLTAERLDVGALLAELTQTLQHQAAVKDATIDIGLMPPLVADRVALEQVFGNVVDNALKYLKPGRPGSIRITAARDGEDIRFAFADNGRGIAPRDYERVFELFRRAGDQSVPGEGIGLAHVRALVRRMGGAIDCASELGTGTTFTIRLPAVATYTKETPA